MQDQGVHFLNSGGCEAWDDDLMITNAFGQSAVFPASEDCCQAQIGSAMKRSKHIRAIPAGSEPHKHISRAAQRLDLAGKNLIVSVIVADACKSRNVCIEADGRQGAPFSVITSNKFLGEMQSIGGTPA